MNPELGEKFQEARELAARAESYEKQGNFQYACRCYLKVSKALEFLLKNASNKQSAKQLQHKIKKYSALAAEMLAKEKQKESEKVKISRFGFPATNAPMTQQNLQKPANRKPTIRFLETDEDIKNIICTDIKISFNDIVGLDDIKQILHEAVILPQKRPDLFEGIRSPPRGLLLYGPPGNGKTYIVKALAKQSGCVFYGLSAGSIMNKFVGETEKMLTKIFQSAKKNAPSIIFIDEIDSILTARAQNESDNTRRLKTEFLVQFDNLGTDSRVILIGATNFPNQLDLAALRRFNKLVYIGLPDQHARRGIVQRALKQITYSLSQSQMMKLVKKLEGYTASQLTDIVKEACMCPLRQIKKQKIETVTKSTIRPVSYQDFIKIIKDRPPLMSKQDLKKFQGNYRR